MVEELYADDLDHAATLLAEEFESNHDGWEAEWPLEMRLYEEGELQSTFEIEREMQPQYIAWEKTK